jgi:hypothetical protein
MAFNTINVTVGTSAAAMIILPVTMGQGRAVQIQNNDSASIFVGASNVATSGATKGHVIVAGQTYQVWVSGGDIIYGISAAGTAAGAVCIQYSA